MYPLLTQSAVNVTWWCSSC